MAIKSAVIVISQRKKMARYMAGEVFEVAFGSGGNTPEGNEIPPSEDATSLKKERFRKKITSVNNEGLSLNILTTLESDELNGIDVSEVAIFDKNKNMIAIKTFKKIKKIVNIRYEFPFTLNF
jgi:hypothetical protein